MPHATYPLIRELSDGTYKAEMIDKKTGRVWGTGYGENRKQAIYYARNDQPSEGFIKRSIGWIVRHPIRAGILVGGYMMFRRPIKQIADSASNFVSQGLYALGVSQKVCTVIRTVAKKVLP